jgi:hypothetical protein
MSETAGSVRWGDASNSSIGSIEYNHNSDYMRLIVNAAERMRIRSSGTVGIGSDGFDSQMLTIAAGTLDGAIYATSTDANCFASFRDSSSTANIEYGAIGNNHVFRKDASEQMRIDSAGNVGIGTTSPDAKLDVEDTVTYQIMAKYNATNYTEYGYFGLNVVGGGNPYLFKLQGTERMRITSAGNIQFAQDAYINTNTADASDNLSLQLSGGGAFGDTRGACIALAGNENGNGGLMQLRAGDGSVGGIRYYTGGSERMRLAGRLISFNSTTGVQEIRGDAASAKFAIGNMGDASSQMMVSSRGFLTLNTSNTGSALDATERMRITSGGYVAIPDDAGNHLGAASLIVTAKASIPYQIWNYSGTSTSFRLQLDQYVTAGNVRQYFNQINAGVSHGFSMTFNTGSVIFGDLEVASATQNSGSAFKKDSKARMTLCQGSNSTALTDLQEYFNPNGAVGKIQTSGSATLFTTSSDYRLKEDLKSFSGLEVISKIPVYDFKWKISDERGYGVMAHELQEVLPQAVGGDKDYEKDHVVKEAKYDDNHNLIKEAEYGKRPSYQTVDYSKIVPLLIKSIQELKAEIEILKNK